MWNWKKSSPARHCSSLIKGLLTSSITNVLFFSQYFNLPLCVGQNIVGVVFNALYKNRKVNGSPSLSNGWNVWSRITYWGAMAPFSLLHLLQLPTSYFRVVIGVPDTQFFFQKFCNVYVALEILSSDLCLYILDRKCFFGV